MNEKGAILVSRTTAITLSDLSARYFSNGFTIVGIVRLHASVKELNFDEAICDIIAKTDIKLEAHFIAIASAGGWVAGHNPEACINP